MLKEFDSVAAPNEEVQICYFRNGLTLSIWAQSNKKGRDLDIWKKAIEKAIHAKAKTICQPQFLIEEIDNCCLWDHQSFKIDKPAKEQKNSDSHKSKPQKQKTSAPRCFDITKISEKAQKD